MKEWNKLIPNVARNIAPLRVVELALLNKKQETRKKNKMQYFATADSLSAQHLWARK